jgi:hypothetical protein
MFDWFDIRFFTTLLEVLHPSFEGLDSLGESFAEFRELSWNENDQDDHQNDN